MLDHVDSLPPSDIAEHVSRLRLEHRELDARIVEMGDNPQTDEIEIKRLKKRKLQLKDCIARLESMLIPDEPA